MSRKKPADEWGDLDSDDIASVASDELHAHRPNRWTGPASTWRNLTKDERLLWKSMERIRSEDLALHLYNAFALKRQATEPEGRKFLTVATEDGKEIVWQPPKAWTAWPLKPSQLPFTTFVHHPSDQHDHLTFSQPSYPMPSTSLHEELNANILRIAKDRFRRRMAAQAKRKDGAGPIFASIEGPTSDAAPSSPGSEASYRSGREEKRGHRAVSDMEVDEEDSRSPKIKVDQKKKRIGRPQVSADDEYSEEILRAPVRHILTQLDKTLTILHHGRVAMTSHLEEPSDYEDNAEFEPGGPSTPRNRKRRATSRSHSRSRSQSRSRAASRRRSLSATPAPPSRPTTPGGTARPRGRPRKVHVPLEGETPEEMAIRVARQSHRANPATVARRQDAAFEAWLQKGEADEQMEKERAEGPDLTTTTAAAASASTGAAEGEGKSWREQKLDRMGLRDWGDVLGAAALAGFSEEVIDRTMKRCAKLFGQGMVMRRLTEVPFKAGGEQHGDGVVERIYRPGELHTEDTDFEDDNDMLHRANSKAASISAPASRLHSLSRYSSLAPTRSPTPSSSAAAAAHHHIKPSTARHAFFPSATPPPILSSPSRSRSRSRSRSATADMYCPEPSCPRSAKGFDRRANLERHVRLVHGGRRVEDWEVDSDDDVVGGVRVDGFLREIVPETGWFKKRRVRSRQVARREEAEEEEDDDEDGGSEST